MVDWGEDADFVKSAWFLFLREFAHFYLWNDEKEKLVELLRLVHILK